MTPYDFWLEFDERAEEARRRSTVDVGGKKVPLSAVEEAQRTARRLHKAKQEEAAE